MEKRSLGEGVRRVPHSALLSRAASSRSAVVSGAFLAGLLGIRLEEVRGQGGILAGLLSVAVSLVLCRLTLLFGQVFDFLCDTGFRDRAKGALKFLWEVVSLLDAESWHSFGHDNTSPTPRVSKVEDSVLSKGIGQVGSVEFPREVWDGVVPTSFAATAREGGGEG